MANCTRSTGVGHIVTLANCTRSTGVGHIVTLANCTRSTGVGHIVTLANCTRSTGVGHIVTLANFSLFIHFGWSSAFRELDFEALSKQSRIRVTERRADMGLMSIRSQVQGVKVYTAGCGLG